MNPIARIFIQLHNALYRATGGQKFNMGGSVLLLNTTGAKSGKPRCNPLMHIKEGDNFVVVASAAGADKHPGWYHNLRAHPDATVELEGRSIPVHATVLTEGERRAALYERMVEHEPRFAEYAHKTQRVIPVVVLQPRAN